MEIKKEEGLVVGKENEKGQTINETTNASATSGTAISAKKVIAGIAAVAVVGGTATGIAIHNHKNQNNRNQSSNNTVNEDNSKVEEPEVTIEACSVAVDGDYVYYPEKDHVYKLNLETQEREEILSNDEAQEYLELAYDGEYLYTVESYMWDPGLDEMDVIEPEADKKAIDNFSLSSAPDAGIEDYYGEPEGDDGYMYDEPEGDDGYISDEPEGDDGYMSDEPEGDDGYDAAWSEEEYPCRIYRYDLKTMDKQLLGRGSELIIEDGKLYYISLEEDATSVVSVDLKTGKKEILTELKDEKDLELPDEYMIVYEELFYKDGEVYIRYDYMESITINSDMSISGGHDWGYKAFDMDGNEVNVEDFGITVLPVQEYEPNEMAAEFGAQHLFKYEQTYDGWTYVDTVDHKFIINKEGEKIQLC